MSDRHITKINRWTNNSSNNKENSTHHKTEKCQQQHIFFPRNVRNERKKNPFHWLNIFTGDGKISSKPKEWKSKEYSKILPFTCNSSISRYGIHLISSILCIFLWLVVPRFPAIVFEWLLPLKLRIPYGPRLYYHTSMTAFSRYLFVASSFSLHLLVVGVCRWLVLLFFDSLFIFTLSQNRKLLLPLLIRFYFVS